MEMRSAQIDYVGRGNTNEKINAPNSMGMKKKGNEKNRVKTSMNWIFAKLRHFERKTKWIWLLGFCFISMNNRPVIRIVKLLIAPIQLCNVTR